MFYKSAIKTLVAFMIIGTTSAFAGNGKVKYISVLDLDEQKDDMYVIDIRKSKERIRTGIIEDSEKITLERNGNKYNMEGIMKKIQKIVPDNNTPFALVSEKGRKAKILGNFIKKKSNFQTIYILKGGVEEWIYKELDLEETYQ